MTHRRILVFSTLSTLFVSVPAGANPKSPEAVYSIPYDDHAVEQMMKHPEDEGEVPGPTTAPVRPLAAEGPQVEEPHPVARRLATPPLPMGEGTTSPTPSPIRRGASEARGEVRSAEAKTYKVYIWQENGDTLWRIAQKMYGDKDKWPLIYDANRDILQDPDKIYPRQVLKIPPLEGQP